MGNLAEIKETARIVHSTGVKRWQGAESDKDSLQSPSYLRGVVEQ